MQSLLNAQPQCAEQSTEQSTDVCFVESVLIVENKSRRRMRQQMTFKRVMGTPRPSFLSPLLTTDKPNELKHRHGMDYGDDGIT
jgi:hypothetical protein